MVTGSTEKLQQALELQDKIIDTTKAHTDLLKTAMDDTSKVFTCIYDHLLTRQPKTDNYANSVDPDEMACNEPSHQDPRCLPFCFNFSPKLLFALVDMPKFKN